MEINRAKFERVVKEAKAKAAGNARWIAAIDTARKLENPYSFDAWPGRL